MNLYPGGWCRGIYFLHVSNVFDYEICWEVGQWEHFAEAGQYELYSGTFQSVVCLLNLSTVRVGCKIFI